MTSQILKSASYTKTQKSQYLQNETFFLQKNKKKLHIKCCFMTKNSFVAEVTFKFLKNLVKEQLNFSQMTYIIVIDFLNVNVKHCSFFLAKDKHLQKITRIICEIFEIKYIDTSFQLENKTEI